MAASLGAALAYFTFQVVAQAEAHAETLMPGFIDPHSHMAQQVPRWGVPTLSPPPVGDVTSIADIVVKLKAYIADNKIPAGTPILAMGYDDSLLKEGHHPTAAELDPISSEHPIALLHQSGHLGAVNTAMLALMEWLPAHLPEGIEQCLAEIDRGELGQYRIGADRTRLLGIHGAVQ